MMMSPAILTFFIGLLFEVSRVVADTYGCHADNCARAVTGTRLGVTFQAQATLDCLSYVGQATVTGPPHTISTTTTSTINITVAGNTKRDAEATTTSPAKTIPTYATACLNPSQYISACSCMGITAGYTTVSGPAVTVTVTSKTTQTVTSTSSSTTCSANLANDPNNCGSCGHVCSTGICSNGSCSSTQCPDNQTCDSGFKTCGQSSCFCFADYLGAGFCGENAVCAGRQTCNDNKDCDIGSICATKTCCPAGDKPGICLIGTCSNPGAKLIRMAAMLRREQYIGGDTAAWSAYWG